MGSRLVSLAAAACACAVVAAGCATIPASGPVRQVSVTPGAAGQGQAFQQLIPLPPGRAWSPDDVVSGFLAASASAADNRQIAREYLVPGLRKKWNPGWGVTVVGNHPRPYPISGYPKPMPGQPNVRTDEVKVTGQRLATLTDSGQYLRATTRGQYVGTFTLVKTRGRWLISKLPSSGLLMTEDDFLRVYQPRNLYFLSSLSSHGGLSRDPELVPDPVSVPQQATDTALATGLVTALLKNPVGWLHGAATTSFPAGTTLLGPVRIDGPDAFVNLGGRAARATAQRRANMAAQLAWTLESGSYGPSAIRSVVLEIDNRPQVINDSLYQRLGRYSRLVPGRSTAPASLYFIGRHRSVQVLPGVGRARPGAHGAAHPVPGQAGDENAPALSAIAVSPDHRSIAGIAARGGTTIYAGRLRHGAPLTATSMPGGRCTSLSWDPLGSLWAACGGTVWEMHQGNLVDLGGVSPPGRVTAFRVAPDGVRAAMIVQAKKRGRPGLWLGAINRQGQVVRIGATVTIGASIPKPEAVSWLDPDDVVVLAGARSGTQLWKVPVNGGRPTRIVAEPTVTSITAGNSEVAASSSSSGSIMTSTTAGASWQPTQAVGTAPAFPG